MTVRAFTDGACLRNPGPGGWAYVVDGGSWASGAEAHTTNQRMEITAALRAVEALPGPLVVVSDSTYVVNCFRQRWWEAWLRRGWLNSKKEPVANRDLWEPLVDLVRECGDVEFAWVKGHSGDRLNDAADRLATEAALSQQPRSGDRFDDAVVAGLAADAPGAAGAAAGRLRDGDLVDGHGIVVVGHRPPELGGYGNNPVASRVMRQLVDILRAKLVMHDDAVVLTGLGLGAEQLAAEAAAEAGVPYVAVLAFPDPDSVWSHSSREHFARLRKGARAEVVVSREAPASKAEAGKALGRRDDWLARHGAEAIMVWDRADDSLARLYQRLTTAFGDDVWILEPGDV